jgi:hypothetical protein
MVSGIEIEELLCLCKSTLVSDTRHTLRTEVRP